MNIVSRFGAVALASALLLGAPAVASAEVPNSAPHSEVSASVSKVINPTLKGRWLCRAGLWFC